MLLQLLMFNRSELIRRCRVKAAARLAPRAAPQLIEHGVPLFLEQLVAILAREKLTTARPAMAAEAPLASTEIGRAAALNGMELLRLGYRLDQVVHHYGDVGQYVAELAIEQHATITADQFRTLNRCLDEAIAGAVSAFAANRDTIAKAA